MDNGFIIDLGVCGIIIYLFCFAEVGYLLLELVRVLAGLDPDEEGDWGLLLRLLVEGRVGHTDQHHVVGPQPLEGRGGRHQDVEEDVAEAGAGPHHQLQPPALRQLEVEVPEAALHVLVALLVEQLALLGVESILLHHRLGGLLGG